MSYIMMVLGWVLRFFGDVCDNYGIAIILFTIFIKLVLLPLTVKQQSSMLKTQKIQPLLNELQQKYGNDKEKLNQETMKLYQRYNINPMGGCLPMLIQFPILIMLYWVVRKPVIYIMGFGGDEVWRIVSAMLEYCNGSEENLNAFLSSYGIESIAKLTDNAYKSFGNFEIQIARILSDHPDIMNSQWILETGKHYSIIQFNFLGLDLSQTPNLGALFGLCTGKTEGLDLKTVYLWIIPVLSGVSAYVTSKVSQMQSPQPQNTNGDDKGGAMGSMKTMMVIMPLMSVWFAFTLPAGIGLYWIISNILSLVQQVVLNKVLNPGITEEEIEGEIVSAKKSRKKRKK